MTTFGYFNDRTRDQQDGVERHTFGSLKHTDTGAMVTLKGNGTQDDEVPVMYSGYGFNLADDADAEVFAFSLGSDTNNKYAVMTLPRDKQRKWAAGTGGIQNPLDPSKAFEFNDKRAHVTDPNFAVGSGLLEIKDGKIFIRGDVVISGKATINEEVVTPVVSAGSETIPGFEE